MQPLRQHRKLISLLAPLAAFFVLGSLVSYDGAATEDGSRGVDGTAFLWLLTLRVTIMLGLITWFWRDYRRDFPIEVDHWGFITGIIGAVIWIGLCELGLEQSVMSAIGLSHLGERSGINPFETYTNRNSLGLFLSLRFTLLVVAVPIAEELFLRGFFMRAVDASNWQDLPLRQISFTGLAAGTLYGVASHPGEFLAAATWFTMVTVVMVKTNRFWNCVVAHVITNLILGVYICSSESWYLW